MSLDELMLEELKKIRELLNPSRRHHRRKVSGLCSWTSLERRGVLGLAVGFIMSTYIGKVVSALVQDIIMLIPGALTPGGDW